MLAGALYAGHRRAPARDRRRARGDHDDHAQLDRALGRQLSLRPRRPAAERRADGRFRSRTTSSPARTCTSSGAIRSCRGCTSASSSRSRRSSSTGCSSTGRRSASRSAPSASIRRRRATPASPSRATTSSRWRSPGVFAGLAGAVDVLGWEFRLATNDIQASTIGFIGHRRRAARPKHARSASSSRRCCSARSSTGTSTRNLDPDVFRPDLAGNLTLIIQGLVVLFVGADVLVLYCWIAQAAAAESGA